MILRPSPSTTPSHPAPSPPAWGAQGGMLQCPVPPTRDTPVCPTSGHLPRQHCWQGGGRLLPSPGCWGRRGGGSGFIRAGMLPQQEAGAPAGLAPCQHRGGRSETANKEQNLPF